jgi:hypothetical protein
MTVVRSFFVIVMMFTAIGGGTPGIAFQPRPDFSGQWTAESAPSPTLPGAGAPAPRGDMGSGWGSPLTITQDASRLVVEHARFSRSDLQPPIRLMFALDGSPTQNGVMIGHTTQMRLSRAAWDGQMLSITTSYPLIDPTSGRTITTDVTHRLSLDAGTLVIDVVRSGVLGGQSTSTRIVHRKTG